MSVFTQLADSFFSKNSVDIHALSQELDGMAHPERLEWMGRQSLFSQAALWEASAGRGVTLEHLVPPETPWGAEVIHEGRNTLPVLSRFQKRFTCDINRSDILYGYNEGVTRSVIGPGYFVAEPDPVRGEVGVNYYRVPPGDVQLPQGWPEVRTNEEGLQRFVFSTMVDYLRKVSSHVSIGRAYRANRETRNYFLLCRCGD
jgi:hypothetical protein